ncbi:hypothetical protein GobsT_71520 [Gemmata obscuriglobus]|uniref:RNA polymerase sigma-70 region 2 domain-containing protein n=1 Tax=Gemmata obscuriglobus TaxID=114 RepID=A0A2Z3HJW0_9BACT|nr:sigma factor [Gemmata obscuriglobus]AWM41750.1 hypothetical protein C1280_35300 [Gemmata obscuriglobus]QEG32299.1 hypothetical protein GobsT_71520 [Gemmata obscuriglobus]VTS11655.1 hypothetical protein : : Sigma70_r2 [Gemmata obscuriglobus UQM 2246]
MGWPQNTRPPLTPEQRDLAGAPESIALALSVANRMARKCPGLVEEYRAEALYALCEAAASYRPESGTWESWARQIATGRVIDMARTELGRGMGIPRRLRNEGRAPSVVHASAPASGSADWRDLTVADTLPADELPVGWEVESEDTVLVYSTRVPAAYGEALRAYLLRADLHGRTYDVAEHLGRGQSWVSLMLSGATKMLQAREGSTTGEKSVAYVTPQSVHPHAVRALRHRRKRRAVASK